MDANARSGIKEAFTEITVTRADGTVQTYGVVSHSDWGRRQRLVAAVRTWRLNAAARKTNPDVPRNSLLATLKQIIGDN